MREVPILPSVRADPVAAPLPPRAVESPFQHAWVVAHAASAPHSPAVATPRGRLSYADLAQRMLAFAVELASAGIGPGDRVLVALPNCPAGVAAALALNVRGAVPVEVGRDASDAAIARVAATIGVRAWIVHRRDLPEWQLRSEELRPDAIWVVSAGSDAPLERAVFAGCPVRPMLEDGTIPGAVTSAGPPPVDVDPDSPAVILMTSGSTGVPHAVAQTHRNIEANSRSIVEYLALTSDDRALLTLPLSYCYGRSVLQTHLLVGGSVFLDNRFAFPRTVLGAMVTEGCTGFAGVPLTFEILRRQVDVASMRFPSLRYLTQAGGAMAAATTAWVREAFRPAELFVMYGQTEATARLAYLPPSRAFEKAGSIGVPIPNVELRVVDPAGRALPEGSVGELVARGANVTAGYVDDAAATARILHDGWLWTGDLAERDADGFFFLRGRLKEILKVGGHRVSPAEIEEVLARHPAVEEAAVVGAPDPLLGEVPVAYIVAPTVSAAIDDLRRFCQQRLPGYAVPTAFIQIDALPRTAAGKLQRPALAERALIDGRARGPEPV